MKEGNRLLLRLLPRRLLLRFCGGGVVDATYVTYVSLFFYGYYVCLLLFALLLLLLLTCACMCVTVFWFRFSLRVVFISSFRGKIFTSFASSSSRGGSLSPRCLNAASNKHTHVHTHTRTDTRTRTMLVSKNYFAFINATEIG